MTNDLGEQSKPTPEGQPKEGIIELGEWFKPFETYDQLSYAQESIDPEQYPTVTAFPALLRTKTQFIELANIGKFSIDLFWSQNKIDEPYPSKYLLVLPNSERIIESSELKSEQEKMETRPIALDVRARDESLYDRDLPFELEAELPSGQIIKGKILKTHDLGDGETAVVGSNDHWNIDGERIYELLIPESAYVFSRLKLRFVPKE